MTDRELLELAAKACGYDISHRWNALRMTMTPPVAALCIDGVSTAWDPLADDGHALRLAVALRITIHLDGNMVEAQSNVGYHSEPYFDDACAATRRAIVRAAAEIGKEKQ